MRPSTGTTSPGPTTNTSSTTTSASGITLTSEPTRRRANRGARSSKARKSWEARRAAAASRARPPASITAINAPARYSPTSKVPTSDSTAIRSTPTRPWRNAASTHTTAGTTAVTVPAIQHQSATARHPASHAIPPVANAATVTATKAGSTSLRNRIAHPVAGPTPPTVDILPPSGAHLRPCAARLNYPSRTGIVPPSTGPQYRQPEALRPARLVDPGEQVRLVKTRPAGRRQSATQCTQAFSVTETGQFQ